MPEKVLSVDDRNVVTLQNGKKVLCNLIYVVEKEKRLFGGSVSFSRGERDTLYRGSLEKLVKANMTPDFYFEKWPAANSNRKPIAHLSIEFYKRIKDI